jgi:hypothetical protein
MKKPTNRRHCNFMLPLSAHDTLAKIRKSTGYTATQAVVAAVEVYQPNGNPQVAGRGVDRAPLRIVLPARTGVLLERIRTGYAEQGKQVSRQDVISEVLRTYIVRS